MGHLLGGRFHVDVCGFGTAEGQGIAADVDFHGITEGCVAHDPAFDALCQPHFQETQADAIG
jgi:hypothetical protein